MDPGGKTRSEGEDEQINPGSNGISKKGLGMDGWSWMGGKRFQRLLMFLLEEQELGHGISWNLGASGAGSSLDSTV